MSSWVRSRSSSISERTSSMCMPGGQRVLGDAVVQLAGDAVALVVEHLALPRRAQLGLGGHAARSLRALRSAAWRAVRACRRAEWSSSAQFCSAAAVWPARMRSTEWSVSSISRSVGVHAANPPTTRPSSRIGHVQVVAAPGARRASPSRAGRARTWSTWWRTCSGRSSPSGPRTRWRGPDVRQLALDQREHHPLRARGARRRRPRRPAPAPRSPPWCAPARRRSAPAPGSPGAAARRRSGTPGSSAACPSAGR